MIYESSEKEDAHLKSPSAHVQHSALCNSSIGYAEELWSGSSDGEIVVITLNVITDVVHENWDSPELNEQITKTMAASKYPIHK